MSTKLDTHSFRKHREWLSPLVAGVTCCLFLAQDARAQQVGDQWTGRRGDSNPGLSYSLMTTTSTGRMIALSEWGHLMISDNGGTDWRFSQIRRAPGVSLGYITDIIEHPPGSQRLVAIASEMVSGGPLGYKGRTLLHVSGDNGNSWSTTPFPHDSAPYGAHSYEGVALTGLHISPAGELLAYGTTQVSSNLFLVWSIGGLIYRSNDGGATWTLARFAYGPLEHMANANGRLVAVGATTVLDSADGAGWNGYFLADGLISDNGNPLPASQSDRIRLHDVTVSSGGVYTAFGVIHVPLTEIIDSPYIARQFTLISSSPFGPGRNWTLHDQPAYPGRLLQTSSGALLGLSSGGVRSSSDAGATWSAPNTNPRPRHKSFTRSGSNITVVNSSQEAWRSVDNGGAWTKVWDDDVGPNLSVAGVYFGRLYARSYNGDLYVSEDNGSTWTKHSEGTGFNDLTQAGDRLIMPGSSSQTVRVSDDEGVTWETRQVHSDHTGGGYRITATPTGRLVMAAQSRSIQNNGAFYISDDNGETWEPRIVTGLTWGETPNQIFCTAAGTLIATSNSFSVFNPRLMRSEDNGDTWTNDFSLRSLDGLDEVTGDPATKVFTARLIKQSPSGRLLMLGDEDEILTSDDEGKTWTVRMNIGAANTGPWRDWQLEGLAWSSGRWITLYYYNNDHGQRVSHVLVSADDGITWRATRLPFNQSNTYLQYLETGLDGRIIATGSNGAVYTSDPPPSLPPVSAGESVREGDTLALAIERPPFPGEITATYRTVDDSAKGGTDFTAVHGEFTWAEDDDSARTLLVATIDNNLKQPAPRHLNVVIDFASDDGENALAASTDIPIELLDDDGGASAGIQVAGGPVFYTSEDGGSAELRIALDYQPAQPVQIKLTGLDPSEGRLSVTTLQFTAENWNRQQTVVITGVDDWLADGDAAYTLTLTATSADTAYEGLNLEVPVVNTDNDPPEAGKALVVGQQLNLGLSNFGEITGIKGLPKGLRWDKTSQTLVGRVTAAKNYNLTFTLLAEDGSKTKLIVPLEIQALPDQFIGSFSGWMDRDPGLNNGLGGALSFKVTKSAAHSGSIRLAGKRHSWKGPLEVPGAGAPRLNLEVKRSGGLPPLQLDVELLASNRITGAAADSSGTAGITGWRHIWSSRAPVPAIWQGPFNTLFWPDAPWENDPGVPLGAGQVQLKVAKTGAAKWAGRYADATALTGAFHLGPNGDIRHWQALYKNTGSARFAAILNAPDHLDGSGDWLRLPQIKPTRSYPDGFGLDERGPLTLLLAGGRWVKPGKGENLLSLFDLSETPGNMRLSFLHGGIDATATPPDTSPTLDARNRLRTDKLGDTNPAGVTLSISSSTGLVNGALRPRDDDPEKEGKSLVRTTKFQGLWVPRLDRAEGAFQLPQLALPGVTTKHTSPILSGQVILTPAAPEPP